MVFGYFPWQGTQETPPPSPSNLILSLSFEDNLNNDVPNGITFSQTSGTAATFPTGKAGKAMFSGNSIFESSKSDNFKFNYPSDDALSGSFWWLPNNDPDTNYFAFFVLYSDATINNANASVAPVWHFALDNDGLGRLRIITGTTNQQNGTEYYNNTACNSAPAINDLVWQMISFFIEKEGSSFTGKIWRNTTLVASGTLPSEFALMTTNSFFKVVSSTAGGKLDQFYMWKKALTDSDVSALYNSGNGRDYAWVAANLP